MANNYSEKLKDPRWQKKRLEVMQRDNFCCRSCGNNERTLHVHHLKYSGEPWEAQLQHLITLCDECHEFETIQFSQCKIMLIDSLLNKSFLAFEFKILSEGLTDMQIINDTTYTACLLKWVVSEGGIMTELSKRFDEHIAKMTENAKNKID